MRLIRSADRRRRGLCLTAVAAALGLAAGWGLAADAPASAAAPAGAGSPARPSEGARLLQQLAADFGSLETFEAEFLQTQRWIGMEETPAWRGTLYLKRPNRFRLEYSDPKGHLQVCDGHTVWTYVPENGEVLKYELTGEALKGGDLLRWVLENGRAEDAVVSERLDKQTARLLVVVPPEGLGLTRVRFWIREESLAILQYEVTDSSGNRTLYRLLKVRRDPPLKDDLFRFTPPPGVPVVEMGHP